MDGARPPRDIGCDGVDNRVCYWVRDMARGVEMTAYADCPDARFLIEWRTARAYDATNAEAMCPYQWNETLKTMGEYALYYYLIFYARVSGDL